MSMTSFLLTVLLLSQPDAGDAFRWPNREWFRQEARQWANHEVVAYPYLGSDIIVRRNAKVTFSLAGSLGAYVDAKVWSRDYGVFFDTRIWISLPIDRVWRSDSATSL